VGEDIHQDLFRGGAAMLRQSVASLALLAGAVALAPAPGARGCLVVRPRGQEVRLATESAIIVWDAASQTQHFIRRARFETRARDFGFIVPTPTRPTLAEATDKAFDLLERYTRPLPGRAKRKAGAPPPRVVVLETKRVAGLDAVVLRANDATALNDWLKKNGYPSRPAYTSWLKPYVARGWIVTAFKIAKGAEGSAVGTKAVRMSFKTDRPFFPYREPEEAGRGTGPRLLRIYFLGEAAAEGVLGERGKWPGRVVGGRKLAAYQQKEALELLKLPAATLKPGAWVTRFEDSSKTRPGNEDVYFRAR
jgi:hypothetical protein